GRDGLAGADRRRWHLPRRPPAPIGPADPGDRPPRPLRDPPRRQPLLAHPGAPPPPPPRGPPRRQPLLAHPSGGLRLVALLPGRPLGPPRLRDHRGPDRVRLPAQQPLRPP